MLFVAVTQLPTFCCFLTHRSPERYTICRIKSEDHSVSDAHPTRIEKRRPHRSAERLDSGCAYAQPILRIGRCSRLVLRTTSNAGGARGCGQPHRTASRFEASSTLFPVSTSWTV